jgi:hypothetical protein
VLVAVGSLWPIALKYVSSQPFWHIESMLVAQTGLCLNMTSYVTQHPPVHHPLETSSDSVVDELQQSYQGNLSGLTFELFPLTI